MEEPGKKSESDKILTGPSSSGAASLPKFAPGSKAASKKITQIKIIDPEKIRQLGLEKTIAAAVEKLQVKTQKNTDGGQTGGYLGTAKQYLSEKIRKTLNASKNKETPSSNTAQAERPTTIDVKKLIKKKILAEKRRNLHLKNDSGDKVATKMQQKLSKSNSHKKVSNTSLTTPKVPKELDIVSSPSEHFKAKTGSQSIEIRRPIVEEKNVGGLSETDLTVNKATKQLKQSEPRKYKRKSATVTSKISGSSEVKRLEVTQDSDQSPKKGYKEDDSKIPSFSNLRHYLHHKRSQNEGSENSSDSMELSKDRPDSKRGKNSEEEKVQKQTPISVLKVRKKGPLVKKPEETLVSGKIDVILTTDPEKDKTNEIKVLSELQKPSEESDDEPRTVVLKVINRDLKSGKIEMELIDPLIQPEKVQAVVSSSTVDSAENKEEIKDNVLDVGKESTDHAQKPENKNIKIIKASHPPRTCSSSSSSDEAIDSTDLFQKHMQAIIARPKTVEDVMRKLSFSDPCSDVLSKSEDIKTLPSTSANATQSTTVKRELTLENKQLKNCENLNTISKNSATNPTYPLNFGGFFKKATSESECEKGDIIENSALEETAVDFLLSVKNKVDESLIEESISSDCDSASLMEFDTLFEIKERPSNNHKAELKQDSVDRSIQDFPTADKSIQDPLTAEDSHSPYYELLGFKGSQEVIANLNHCDDHLLEQDQTEENLKPIIIENKILSDQEKIDTMAVLSKAGHHLNQSMGLPPTIGHSCVQSENAVVIMENDLPAQEEVEVIAVDSVDNSNNDFAEDYGFFNDGEADIELISRESSFESSINQSQVEVLKIVSSTENTTDQVIVLSVEHNVEALEDAEGTIVFPFDSPVKKYVDIKSDENTSELILGSESEKTETSQIVDYEQIQDKNETIMRIEEGDDNIPVVLHIPVEHEENVTNESIDDGKNSSKSSIYVEISDQISVKDILEKTSNDQNNQLNTTKRCRSSETNENKSGPIEEKRPRKNFKPVPKLRLALKNKKRPLNVFSNLSKLDEETKSDVSGREKAQQNIRSCGNNDEDSNENNSPVDIIISQSSSDTQIFEEMKQTMNQNEDNKNMIREQVGLEIQENQTVKSIASKEKQIDYEKDNQNIGNHSLLLNNKRNDFEKCNLGEDLLKISPKSSATNNFEESTAAAENLVILPKSQATNSYLSNQAINEDSFENNKDHIKTKISPLPNGKNPQLKAKSSWPSEETNIEIQPEKIGTESEDLQVCAESPDQSDSNQFLKEDLESVTHTTAELQEMSDVKNKIVKKGNRRKDELTILKPKQKTLVDYFSTCNQNESSSQQVQLSSEELKIKDHISVNNKITSTNKIFNVGKDDHAELTDEINKELTIFGEPQQYKKKITDIINKIQKEVPNKSKTNYDNLDLNSKEAEDTIKTSGKQEDVGKADVPSQTKRKPGRPKKGSKISILEKWSHSEPTTSPNNATVLKNEKKLEDQTLFEADINEQIKSTPNPIVKKRYNRKSEPENISKGYSVIKVAGDPNGEIAVESESSTPNPKCIKVESNFTMPNTPAEIPKKRGRKPRSSLPVVVCAVDETSPSKSPIISTSSEVSRRGRVIKLTEKRRLSDIFNESKAKPGRKRKTPFEIKTEPENVDQLEITEDAMTSNNIDTECETIPGKKRKREKVIKSEGSDSDSDIPLIEQVLKKSKNGETSALTRKRGAPRKLKTSSPVAGKASDPDVKTSKLYIPKEKGRTKERKYDIELKLHPKLLLVTNREDLYKNENQYPPAELQKGEVRCGFCKEATQEHKWKQHVESHYCIGWKEGEPALDVEDYRIVLNAINYYIRHNHIEFIKCRLCSTPMKSAIGLLFHVETCKATLGEKAEMKYTCACGKVLTSKLWAPAHFKSCKHLKEQPVEQQEPTNVSKKRKAVLKAEQMIKEKIKEELEETAEDLIKPIVNKIVGAMTKWRFQLRKKGMAFCVGFGCNFASKELPELHDHAKTCEKILWTGFSCIRCRFEHAEKNVVLQHIHENHIKEKEEDFKDSGSEAKLGSVSSESEAGSGDEEETQQPKAKRKPSKHTELFSDKWKKVYPIGPNIKCQEDAVRWTKNFRKSNYSTTPLYTYAIPEPTILPPKTAHQIYANNEESMKFFYNTQELCNRKFNSSVKPEVWTKLGRFESKHMTDEIITFIGGPVTNVAWIPIGDHETSKQYLAVTYKKDFNDHAKYKNDDPYKSCMLIYELDYISYGLLKILYGVIFDNGPILDIQFLPSGGYAPELNRLSLVAVASTKTDPKIYSLPLQVTGYCDIKGFPIVKLKPSIVMYYDLDSGFEWTRQCTKLSWSKFKDHHVIVGGLINGFVAVWDISEEDNLNYVKRDGEHCVIPTNFFQAADRRILDIDLHYDSHSARWLVLTTECKEVKLFDLRDITSSAIIIDDTLRTVVYNLQWPVYWENPIMCYGDEIQKGITGVMSFSPIGVIYRYRKGVKCASGSTTGSFIEWKNSHVIGCLNGDLIAHRCGDWRHDVAFLTDFACKYLSYTDLVSLQGESNQLSKTDPNLLSLSDMDHKEKYGLIMSNFQRCGTTEPETKYERDAPFGLQQYVKINMVAGNPNASGKELIAAGYENGLLRICLYKSRKKS